MMAGVLLVAGMLSAKELPTLPDAVSARYHGALTDVAACFALRRETDLEAGMASDSRDTLEPSQLQQECELYRRLLDLGQETSPTPLLEQGLELLVDLTGAAEGYVELNEDGDLDGPRWSVARGMSNEQVRQVRGTISRGIIAAAIASGETIVTADARLDERFNERDSVRGGHIKAVLCAPIGAEPPRGVLYLVGGTDAKRFSDVDQRRVEFVCTHLAPVVDRILIQHRLTKAASDPTRPYRAALGLEQCVGRSQALADVFAQVAIAARTDQHALILGETGSGKSLIARVIHDNSSRKGRPFLTFNVTGVQDSLVEAELFGHERGSFTDAIAKRKGLIAQAEQGTLFLDEVGEMSPKLQAALLHFLESKEYIPIGGVPARADVRIIAGTNVDLERAVAEGRFRRDLRYRLDVITFRMPGLVERREDIVLLAEAFRDEAARSEGCSPFPFSPAAIRALEAHSWVGGNLRELQNAVKRAVATLKGAGGTQIEPAHLFDKHRARQQDEPDDPQTLQEATNRFRKRFIEDVLRRTEGNINQAAKLIDISRSHFYQLMSELGIVRPARS
jgi:DNA-binding NtrC family response regulator